MPDPFLLARIEALEKRVLEVDDLPVAQLIRKIEQLGLDATTIQNPAASTWSTVASITGGYTAGNPTPAIAKIGSLALLSGLVTGGVIGSPLMTLSTAHRPARIGRFALWANGAFARVDVNLDGTIIQYDGSTTNLDLSGIVFITA